MRKLFAEIKWINFLYLTVYHYFPYISPNASAKTSAVFCASET